MATNKIISPSWEQGDQILSDNRLTKTNGNTHRVWRDSGDVLLAKGQSLTRPLQPEKIGVNTGVHFPVVSGLFRQMVIEFRNRTNFDLFDRFRVSRTILAGDLPDDTVLSSLNAREIRVLANWYIVIPNAVNGTQSLFPVNYLDLDFWNTTAGYATTLNPIPFSLTIPSYDDPTTILEISGTVSTEVLYPTPEPLQDLSGVYDTGILSDIQFNVQYNKMVVYEKNNAYPVDIFSNNANLPYQQYWGNIELIKVVL